MTGPDANASHLEVELERPRTRAQCENGPRPCPWVSCRHHLADLRETDGGRLEFRQRSLRADASPAAAEHFTDRAADAVVRMPQTCALDVAARDDERTYQEVGEFLDVTRERARQLTNRALVTIRRVERRRPL